jgi:hypothetical protein
LRPPTGSASRCGRTLFFDSSLLTKIIGAPWPCESRLNAPLPHCRSLQCSDPICSSGLTSRFSATLWDSIFTDWIAAYAPIFATYRQNDCSNATEFDYLLSREIPGYDWTYEPIFLTHPDAYRSSDCGETADRVCTAVSASSGRHGLATPSPRSSRPAHPPRPPRPLPCLQCTNTTCGAGSYESEPCTAYSPEFAYYYFQDVGSFPEEADRKCSAVSGRRWWFGLRRGGHPSGGVPPALLRGSQHRAHVPPTAGLCARSARPAARRASPATRTPVSWTTTCMTASTSSPT